MSAIGGIYNFDGAPVDRRFLALLGGKLARRGPDGGGEYATGSVGMVYRAFHTNQESRRELQPLISSHGHILSWDGRLDNREDLIAALRDYLDGDRTDAALVMAAYLRWGVAFPSRIIGDFALSLWDPISRSLLLARDLVGARLLYYHSDEHRIIWSTSLGALLDMAGIELEIDEEYIADYLTRIPWPEQTPYKGFHGAPPAHIVVAKNGNLRASRFWGLDPGNKVRYKTDAEYEEHFRHLFREAVRCRLRSHLPVWAELSGGLDSSTIVCMADGIVKRGEAEAPSMQTVSRVFDEASGSDERQYIHAVEESIGSKGLHLREDDYRMVTDLSAEYSTDIPNPIADAAEYFKALNDAMREAGARVLLAGQGGDEILTSIKDPSPELVELLVGCKFLQLHRRLRAWRKVSKKLSYFGILWKYALLPALPERIAVPKKSFLATLSRFYDREFVKRMNLRRRLYGPRKVFDLRSPIDRHYAKSFLAFEKAISAGYFQGLMEVDLTYPYSHRPLVEFMMAVPFDQRVRPTQTRSIARRALQDLLPPEVANRKGKGLNYYAYNQALYRERHRLNRLFTDARVSAHGYVNSEAIRGLLDSARSSDDFTSSLFMFVICLEYWLRALETRKSFRLESGPLIPQIGNPARASQGQEMTSLNIKLRGA